MTLPLCFVLADVRLRQQLKYGHMEGEWLNRRIDVSPRASKNNGQVHAFLWTATSGMRDLGDPLRGTFSDAVAINDLGDVTGPPRKLETSATSPFSKLRPRNG
jgi:hypothetical protein